MTELPAGVGLVTTEGTFELDGGRWVVTNNILLVGDYDEAAAEIGLPVLWPSQDATWGRFVVLADPDGRSVVLARMNRPVANM
jgi:predicted enzyme related to lactoylglutathione lyase